MLRSVEMLPVVWERPHIADNLGAGNHPAVEDTAPTEPVAKNFSQLCTGFYRCLKVSGLREQTWLYPPGCG